MVSTTPSSSTSLDEPRGELHFTVGGFWERDAMRGFLGELDETALPLVKARRSILAVGDFTEFVPQDRATADTIRDHLMNACKFGLKRVAIVGASPLMTMQYRRLSQGVEVEFFTDKSEALDWLRS